MFIFPRSFTVRKVPPLDKELCCALIIILTPAEHSLCLLVSLHQFSAKLNVNLLEFYILRIGSLLPTLIVHDSLLILVQFDNSFDLDLTNLLGIYGVISLPGVVDVSLVFPFDQILFLSFISVQSLVGVSFVKHSEMLSCLPSGTHLTKPMIQNLVNALNIHIIHHIDSNNVIFIRAIKLSSRIDILDFVPHSASSCSAVSRLDIRHKLFITVTVNIF